jgi:hypothetical protein
VRQDRKVQGGLKIPGGSPSGPKAWRLRYRLQRKGQRTSWGSAIRRRTRCGWAVSCRRHTCVGCAISCRRRCGWAVSCTMRTCVGCAVSRRRRCGWAVSCRRRTCVGCAVGRRRRCGWTVSRWRHGFRRTFLRGVSHRHFLEKRIARWRQFHAMRAQAFNDATVFPGDPTAKTLHIRTARGSQGAFCHSMACRRAGGWQV